MLPFPDAPDAATPKTLRYSSPETDGWQELTYLPRMAEEDLFGEIVAYGAARK